MLNILFINIISHVFVLAGRLAEDMLNLVQTHSQIIVLQVAQSTLLYDFTYLIIINWIYVGREKKISFLRASLVYLGDDILNKIMIK